MGSSTSKTARKLPKSTPSWAGARTPTANVIHPDGVEPPPSSARSPSASPEPAAPLGEAHFEGNASTRAFPNPDPSPSGSGFGGRSRSGSGSGGMSAGGSVPSRDRAQFEYGQSLRGGKGKGRSPMDRSSEEKDAAIQQDAGVDPDFLAKLSQLGQVVVPKAGTSFERTAPAHQTMLSRNASPLLTSTSSTPPPKHLTSDLLSTLLDRLKTLPTGTDPSKLYREFGVDEKRMESVRRWVNSPSVDRERTRVEIDESGEQSVKMTAIWADNTYVPPEAPKAIESKKTVA